MFAYNAIKVRTLFHKVRCIRNEQFVTLYCMFDRINILLILRRTVPLKCSAQIVYSIKHKCIAFISSGLKNHFSSTLLFMLNLCKESRGSSKEMSFLCFMICSVTTNLFVVSSRCLYLNESSVNTTDRHVDELIYFSQIYHLVIIILWERPWWRSG